MALLHCQRLGADICDALGLDKTRVRSLTFHCEPNQAATVLVEQFLDTEQGERLAAVVREYEVVERGADGDG